MKLLLFVYLGLYVNTSSADVPSLSRDFEKKQDQSAELNITQYMKTKLSGISYHKCPSIYGRVAIVSLVDNEGSKLFEQSIHNLRCYAKTRGYDFILLIHEDFDEDATCSKYKDLMFRRHCILATHILPKYEWVLTLDADNVIVNPFRCIEEYIDLNYDLIHMERFYNGEIQAGNYIVKNSQFSIKYLIEWSDFHSAHDGLPRNKDNGALHVHILQTIRRSENVSIMDCKNLWSWADDYTDFIGCVQRALNGRRTFKKIKIHRRGHGAVRDASLSNNMWCEQDFVLHGLKDNYYPHGVFPLYTRKLESEDCSNVNWVIPYKNENFVTVEDIKTMLIHINTYYQKHMSKHSAGLNGDNTTPLCWPHCPENM